MAAPTHKRLPRPAGRTQPDISDATRALLDERMREHDADPSKGVRWDDLHAQLRKMT
jgi:putative addiction module component (TIGR02574 family)